jgi:hypothetical protein
MPSFFPTQCVRPSGISLLKHRKEILLFFTDSRSIYQAVNVGYICVFCRLSDNPALGADARQVVGEPCNQVLVSVAFDLGDIDETGEWDTVGS